MHFCICKICHYNSQAFQGKVFVDLLEYLKDLHIPPPANILFYFLAFQFFHYLYPIQPYIQLDFAKGQRRNTIRDSGIGKTYTQQHTTFNTKFKHHTRGGIKKPNMKNTLSESQKVGVLCNLCKHANGDICWLLARLWFD